MIPPKDRDEPIRQIMEYKVRAAIEKNTVEVVKVSLRVLREEFNFTPEQISEFVSHMDKKLSGE